MNKRKRKFVPVMLTPFKDNGEVDYRGLTEITEFYLEAGAEGLFANCQSSEMFLLTNEERLAVTRHVISVAAGAVPVVAAGTFGGNLQHQGDFVKKMYDTGVDAVIVITSMLAGEWESQEVFDERFCQFLEITNGIPLGFYECPVPYKRVLSASQLMKFVNTGRIIYHKDTCLDIELVREKLEATKAYPEFGLYDAYMGHAVETLKAGSAGLSCIQGNYFPEVVVWLCNNFNDASKSAEVENVQEFFIGNMDVMHTVYPVVAKYFLQKRGVSISTFTRNFSGIFSKSVQSQVDKLYVDYTLLRQHLELNSIP